MESSSCQTGMFGHPVTSVSGGPEPPPDPRTAPLGRSRDRGRRPGTLGAWFVPWGPSHPLPGSLDTYLWGRGCTQPAAGQRPGRARRSPCCPSGGLRAGPYPVSRGRAADGRGGRRGLSRGPKGSRQLERRRPCSSLLRWRLRGQEKRARERGARPGGCWPSLKRGEAAGLLWMVVAAAAVPACGYRWRLGSDRQLWELRLIQPGPGRQEMRFLREGAGPGGLPGRERKCHGLCRWVGGPGAGVFVVGGRQCRGRTQAPGSSPHIPHPPIPPSPTAGWWDASGCPRGADEKNHPNSPPRGTIRGQAWPRPGTSWGTQLCELAVPIL